MLQILLQLLPYWKPCFYSRVFMACYLIL